MFKSRLKRSRAREKERWCHSALRRFLRNAAVGAASSTAGAASSTAGFNPVADELGYDAAAPSVGTAAVAPFSGLEPVAAAPSSGLGPVAAAGEADGASETAAETDFLMELPPPKEDLR